MRFAILAFILLWEPECKMIHGTCRAQKLHNWLLRLIRCFARASGKS